MHSLLEDYLAEIASHLAPLPLARRDEELRELREHLLNTVAVNREKGQTEDEAALNAVQNFGTPETLGDEVVSAWRRGEWRKSLRSFGGAAFSALALSLLLPRLINPLAHAYLRRSIPEHRSSWVYVVLVILFFAVPVVVGVVSGLAFPKRAVLGTGFAVTTWSIYYLISFSHLVSQRHLVMAPNDMAWRVLMESVGCFISILAAWAGSRWRERQVRTVRA